MVAEPYAFDSHDWQPNEEVDAALLNEKSVRIGHASTTGPIANIQAIHSLMSTTVKVNDSRQIKVSVAGTFTMTANDVVKVRIRIDGNQIGSTWENFTIVDDEQTPCVWWVTINPGVAASHVFDVTMEQVGGGTGATAWAGWELLVTDIGPTAGIYSV